MSKKSRRKASVGKPGDTGTQAAETSASNTPTVTATPVLPGGSTSGFRGILARLAGRRKIWLIVVGLIVWAGVLIYNTQTPSSTRPGFLEFSSEEPDAQVLIEKEGGTETPIERTAKTTLTLEPGHYNFRLAVPNDNLKLWPTQLNLDPNGRGFVKVRKLKL